MGQRILVPLNVLAPLDTSNPLSSLPPGTLVTAEDLASRWWGPRLGGASLSQPHDYATAAKLPGPGDLLAFDGTDSYVSGVFASPEQRDLNDSWTLDLSFRATSVDHGTFDDATIFRWELNPALDAIKVTIRGKAEGEDRDKRVEVEKQQKGERQENVDIMRPKMRYVCS